MILKLALITLIAVNFGLMSAAGAEPFGKVSKGAIRMEEMSLEKAVNGYGAGSNEILSFQASPSTGESGSGKSSPDISRRVRGGGVGQALMIIIVAVTVMRERGG